jgi:type I restriction enzyme S subunit
VEVKVGYKQTEVGVIPDEWEVQSVGSTMKLVNGRAFKPEDWRQHGTPIIRIQNLNDAEAAFNYCDTPIEEKHRITKGDVVFAWSGTTGTSFGARIWNGPTGVLNQHIFRVIAEPQKLTPIYSFLILQRVQQSIEKQAHGFKASFVHVRKSDLVKVALPIPPISEQRAIAEALSDVDTLLVELDRLISKKRDLKQAVMQQLLTGQTRLPGFRDKWEENRIDRIAPLQRGFDLPNSNLRPGPYPVVYSNGILNHHSKWRILGPGVVTGRSGTIGNVAFIEGNYWPHNTTLFVTTFKENDPKFIFYLYTLIGFDRFATGSGVPTLNRNDAHAFEARMPPTIQEQMAITQVLTGMDAELAVLEQRREKTRALKQAMMQELLTGKTRLI